MDVNQPLPWFFTRWPSENSFSVYWALGRICRRFSRFCNILLQIWHRFMSRLRGERICWVFLGGNSNYRHIYLHTVSYNHISFLNRSQLVWVLASSGFYSITWRMISSKIHFRKQPPFREKFFPFQCDIFCFFEFILASWQCVHSSRVLTQSNK